MSAFDWEIFDPEQVVVTSGADPLVDIPLLCPAWMVLDLVKWSVPTKIVENRPNLGEVGSVALDSATDELRTSNRFLLTGTVDQDGAPATDARVQFRRHWVYLSQHLFLPEAPLEAVYTPVDPDEDPIAFTIQFDTPQLNPENGMWPTDWTTNLQVVLPGGPLVPSWGGS
jgi:hypothetical protein